MFDDDSVKIEAAIDILMDKWMEKLASTIRDLVEEGYLR